MTTDALAGQGRRYLLTGGAAAIVDAGLFWLLTANDMPTPPAALFSFLIATLVNYGLSSRYVFASAPSLRSYAKFLAGAGLGLVLNVSITSVLSARLGVAPPLAKIIAIGITFVFNFLVNAFFVFHKAPAADAASPPEQER